MVTCVKLTIGIMCIVASEVPLTQCAANRIGAMYSIMPNLP